MSLGSYTAVDDSLEKDESGAGMIGTVELTSSTLYRFATVDLNALAKNLGDNEATVQAATSFVKSFINSMPTGKQNTFANRTLPEAVIVRVRTDRPISFVNAFESPVRATGDVDRRLVAAQALAAEASAIDEMYGADSIVFSQYTALNSLAPALEDLGQSTTVHALLEALATELPSHLN